MNPEIWFPYLGIEIGHLSRVCITIFGQPVYWYGVIMVTGILCGLAYVTYEAKGTGQNPDLYYDYLIYGLIGAVIGARLYYVIFSWDNYKHDLGKIFAIREGGIAVYGSIIGGLIVLAVFAYVKKLNLALFMDTIAPAFAIGQVVGRWGNFVNREAFGGFTDNIFAMRYLKETVSGIPTEVMDKLVEFNGSQYIQVHPTFLYESLWSLMNFIILLWFRKRKKTEGEVAALYFIIYGIGRFWIEGLRTDQLIIGSTNMAISQLVSVVLVIASFAFIMLKRKKGSDISV